VVPREQILERVWGEDEYIDPRTLDVHISWLREKLEEDPVEAASVILTVRGEGYRLVEKLTVPDRRAAAARDRTWCAQSTISL
jgi:DNA-binding response OmpR family regulator